MDGGAFEDVEWLAGTFARQHVRVRTCKVACSMRCDSTCGETCVNVLVSAMACMRYSLVQVLYTCVHRRC